MRRSLVIGLVLCGLAFVLIGGPSLLLSPSTSDVAPEHDDDPAADVVTFGEDESGFWPYLSAREVHDKRSPINVIVRGDAEQVVTKLVEEGTGDWEEVPEDQDDAQPETYALIEDRDHHATGTTWGEATGTTRYAWVDPGADGEPVWTTETLQLDDGDYYGHRTHIRVYESPAEGEWVAMQAHTEHFDWFTLRHRVDGVETAQLDIEREFMDLPSIDAREDVTRMNLDNAGPADADGWATVVDLTAAGSLVVLLGLARTSTARRRVGGWFDGLLTDTDRARIDVLRERYEPRQPVLAGVIVGLVLGVRFVGIGMERYVDALSMHIIAALLYPVLVLGLPVGTYLVARSLTRRLDAALVASTALVLAIWLDYGYVSVHSLPVDLVFQRMLVVVALGLIAAGATQRARRDTWHNDLLLAGIALWGLVALGTLFGYL